MLIQDTGTPSCRSCPITLSPSVLDMMLRIKLLTGKCVTRAAKLSLPFQCFERQRMDAVVTLYSMTMASILRLSLKLNAHPVHCTLELSACMEIFKVQQANLRYSKPICFCGQKSMLTFPFSSDVVCDHTLALSTMPQYLYTQLTFLLSDTQLTLLLSCTQLTVLPLWTKLTLLQLRFFSGSAPSSSSVT